MEDDDPLLSDGTLYALTATTKRAATINYNCTKKEWKSKWPQQYMRLISMEYLGENYFHCVECWYRRIFHLDSLWRCRDESSDSFTLVGRTFYTLTEETLSDISISIIESIESISIILQWRIHCPSLKSYKHQVEIINSFRSKLNEIERWSHRRRATKRMPFVINPLSPSHLPSTRHVKG